MIKEMRPLSLAEAGKYTEDEQVKDFIKRFTSIKEQDAEKLRKEIEGLDNIKIKEEHIVKIVDILPQDSQDVAKIFGEVSLDENETQKILEIVKKY